MDLHEKFAYKIPWTLRDLHGKFVTKYRVDFRPYLRFCAFKSLWLSAVLWTSSYQCSAACGLFSVFQISRSERDSSSPGCSGSSLSSFSTFISSTAFSIFTSSRNSFTLLPISEKTKINTLSPYAYTKHKAEKFIIKCNLHPFLQTHGFLVENPYYAVTDLNGNFSIENIPWKMFHGLQKTFSGKDQETVLASLPVNETCTFPSAVQKERQSLPVLLPAGGLNPKCFRTMGSRYLCAEEGWLPSKMVVKPLLERLFSSICSICSDFVSINMFRKAPTPN